MKTGQITNEPLLVSSTSPKTNTIEDQSPSVIVSFAAKSSWGRLRSCGPLDADSSDLLKPVNPDDVTTVPGGEIGMNGTSGGLGSEMNVGGVQPVSFRGPRITRAPDEEEEEERRRGPPPLLMLLCLWEVSVQLNGITAY